MPIPTDTVPGDLFIDGDDTVWRCVAYQPQPSVKFQELRAGGSTIASRTKDTAVSDSTLKDFRRIHKS